MNLRPYQEQAVAAMLAHDKCLLEAPTGSGKTVIIGGLIERRPEPTLIIVTTAQLRLQMAEMLKDFNVAEPVLLSTKKQATGRLYISTWQTLKNMTELPRLNMIVSDEAHHISDVTLYGQIIGAINPKYHYAVTATAQRYDGIKELLKLCNNNRHVIPIEVLYDGGYLIRPSLTFINTGCKFDIRQSLTPWEFANFSDEQKLGRMKSVIGVNQERNWMIADYIRDAIMPVERHRHILVLSYTIAQCEDLFGRCPETLSRERFVIHGQEPKAVKRAFFDRIQLPSRSITFATQSFLGEGIDIPKLDTLVIATPFGGGAKTVQFAGRILRPSPGKATVDIYDFCDEMVGIGEYWTKARRSQYGKLLPIVN